MSITDEAIEAAARAFYGTALDDVSEEDMTYALEGARLALEAAAPHMATYPGGRTPEEWQKFVDSYR